MGAAMPGLMAPGWRRCGAGRVGASPLGCGSPTAWKLIVGPHREGERSRAADLTPLSDEREEI
jgi:hypothetical protein